MSTTSEYKLVIINRSLGNHEVDICTIELSKLYERYPEDYFYSPEYGEHNRQKLKQQLLEKLHIEISPIDLDEILSQWIDGIKMNKRKCVICKNLLAKNAPSKPNLNSANTQPVVVDIKKKKDIPINQPPDEAKINSPKKEDPKNTNEPAIYDDEPDLW
jgi:hypothetical protein